jgi:hypothetical protein
LGQDREEIEDKRREGMEEYTDGKRRVREREREGLEMGREDFYNHPFFRS